MDNSSKLRLNMEGLILTLGIAIFPVYVFPSGGVQPSHLLFALFFTISFIRNGIPANSVSILIFLVFIHVLFVESIYFSWHGNEVSLIHAAFYLFNFMFISAVYMHCSRNGLGSVRYGITISAAIAVGAVAVGGVNLETIEETGRNTGAFNNPNQLGYFSVCLLSLAYILHRLGYISYFYLLALFSISVSLSIISLSKAAMISNFLTVLIAINPKFNLRNIIFWLSGVVVSIAILFRMLDAGALDRFLFFRRLVNMANEGDSSLEARGYLAFMDGNFLQVLFGLGAQGVADKVGHEVHSTLGSMLNTYGIVGFLLLFAALSIWAFRIWRTHGFAALICICGPAMLYGLTHNGTRFSIFWLLFAVSLATTRSRTRARGRSVQPSESGIRQRRLQTTP